MEIPEELAHRIAGRDSISRWERSEVGRDLRRLGLSYEEIRGLIIVKKSTLATWCVTSVTSLQIAGIRKRTPFRTGSRAGVPVDTQWRRRQEIHQSQDAAQEKAVSLMQDPFLAAGVVLYWSEGGKASIGAFA